MLSSVTEESRSGLSTQLWRDEALSNARPKLPSIITDEDDGDKRRKSRKGVDEEQRLSRELESIPSHVKATSVPETEDTFLLTSPLSSSFSHGNIPESDISMSPAAMFLSSFSPTTHATSLPDSEGETVAGYTLGPIIGHGGFSTIRRASSPQGGTVAVKIVRRSVISKQANPVLARKRLDREANVWTTLSHEHILPLFSVTRTPYADFFVTLYCPAGSLFDILKRDGRPALPQDDAGMMFRQVVRGLRYLHEVAGIVHGDMKLENVLVDEMSVCRITDFGMAHKIGEVDEDVGIGEAEEGGEHNRPHLPHPRRSHGKQGPLPVHLSLRRHHGPRHRISSPLPSSISKPVPSTPEFPQGSLPYASPELLLPPSTSSRHLPNPAQDIWALGVMLYTLLTGRLPFVDSYDPRLQMKILHGVYEVPQGIGRGAERVLQGCLERSVPSRWTVAMVDEVAWGIGWGAAGDDVTPPSESDGRPSRVASRSCSRSRLSPKLDTGAVDDVESPYLSSRSARSTSRSSGVRRSSRSASRHLPHRPYEPHHHHHPHQHHQSYSPPMQPSLAALTNAILRTSSASSSASSSSLHNDSALLMTPSHSQDREPERGRNSRPKAHLSVDESVSRSVSPIEAPLTPQDISVGSFADAHGRKSSSSALDDDKPLSEPAYIHTRRVSDARSDAADLSPGMLGGHGPKIDEDEVRALRLLPLTNQQSPNVLRGKKDTRPGSMPPTPAPSMSWSQCEGKPSASMPKPIPRRPHATRSRSVDVDFGDESMSQRPRAL
ncbi:hypothetical protein AcV7_004957 [Taiwanofungus camphoratus]|nr:hypothetical protein AcV7_004957 [Antrodia cinnamomea]